MRRGLLAATLALLSGCGAMQRAVGLKDLARADAAKGDHAACATHATESIRLQKQAEPSVDYDNIIGAGVMRVYAEPHYIRARCLDALGKREEAIADMALVAKLMAKVCRTDASVAFSEKSSACQMAADGSELLARWKKEPAPQEENP